MWSDTTPPPRPSPDELARDPSRVALLPSDQRAALLTDVVALPFQPRRRLQRGFRSYRRYSIVIDSDIRAALAKTQTYLNNLPIANL
jgi:hypothetical protein